LAMTSITAIAIMATNFRPASPRSFSIAPSVNLCTFYRSSGQRIKRINLNDTRPHGFDYHNYFDVRLSESVPGSQYLSAPGSREGCRRPVTRNGEYGWAARNSVLLPER
jgi:hypothetical protein